MLREKLLNLDEEMGAVPSEYAMTTTIFADIIDMHGPVDGTKWLSYVWHMRDPRSFINGYPEKQKHFQACQDIFGSQMEIDKYVQKALDEYNKHESSTMKLLRSARESVNNLQQWLLEVDTKADDYDALKHVKILESMGKTVDSLKKLEEMAEAEADESTTYGNVELNEFNR